MQEESSTMTVHAALLKGCLPNDVPLNSVSAVVELITDDERRRRIRNFVLPNK